MKAMILAAGLGTRLRPYTNQRPKPLFPILGRPLLLVTIEKLRKAGFSSIIVNCHHLIQQIINLLENEDDIILQVESTILGTGGGLRMAMSNFDDEPILVTNGDIYHDIDYGKIYQRHLECGCPISLVMHDFPRFNCVQVSSEGYVTNFSKPLQNSNFASNSLAFTGIHVFDPKILSSIPVNCFYSIIDRYNGYLSDGELINAIMLKNVYWQDMGTPTDYLQLHAYLLDKKKLTDVEHLNRVAESNFLTDGDVKLGRNIVLHDWGFIGSGATIGDNSILERVVVWDGAVVQNNSVLKDKIVC